MESKVINAREKHHKYLVAGQPFTATDAEHAKHGKSLHRQTAFFFFYFSDLSDTFKDVNCDVIPVEVTEFSDTGSDVSRHLLTEAGPNLQDHVTPEQCQHSNLMLNGHIHRTMGFLSVSLLAMALS